ncbi:MAG TPA: substrate-binding domain-containing protein, partial [Verrucomicrobiae bacterium]|nr:substrate-binding domain-containing protein [Verrucomicrobiae bacterium]
MKRGTKSIALLLVLMFVLGVAGCGNNSTSNGTQPAKPANPDLILATTTSTQDSGLLDMLIPEFEKKTGYKVKTVAVGTGAALALGEKGEADVLLTHAPASEKKLVDNKAVINYALVMHNDFILVGPASDPAKIKDSKQV